MRAYRDVLAACSRTSNWPVPAGALRRRLSVSDHGGLRCLTYSYRDRAHARQAADRVKVMRVVDERRGACTPSVAITLLEPVGERHYARSNVGRELQHGPHCANGRFDQDRVAIGEAHARRIVGMQIGRVERAAPAQCRQLLAHRVVDRVLTATHEQ